MQSESSYHTGAAATLLDRLTAVRQTGPGCWIARCPAHEDRRPSLSIRLTDAGRLLLHCFAGCPAADIVAAVGLALADLFPPRPGTEYGPPRRHHPASRWPAADVLRCLATDAAVVAIMAHDLAAGRAIDRDRLLLAARRITAAAELAAGGRS